MKRRTPLRPLSARVRPSSVRSLGARTITGFGALPSLSPSRLGPPPPGGVVVAPAGVGEKNGARQLQLGNSRQSQRCCRRRGEERTGRTVAFSHRITISAMSKPRNRAGDFSLGQVCRSGKRGRRRLGPRCLFCAEKGAGCGKKSTFLYSAQPCRIGQASQSPTPSGPGGQHIEMEFIVRRGRVASGPLPC